MCRQESAGWQGARPRCFCARVCRTTQRRTCGVETTVARQRRRRVAKRERSAFLIRLLFLFYFIDDLYLKLQLRAFMKEANVMKKLPPHVNVLGLRGEII